MMHFLVGLLRKKIELKLLSNKQPFANYKPHLYFKPTNRLDNNFIEGYLGHTDFNENYHYTIDTAIDYFKNYEARTPVYFSFDRVTLYRLIEIHPTKPLTFILKRIDNLKIISRDTASMIMPFRPENLNAFYQKHIKKFLIEEANLKIKIYRADDFNDNDIIIETIYNQIEKAEFIIADITHPNKNVFYELGWAAASGKEIITIHDKEMSENIFFDRNHIRSILFSQKNIPEFHMQLKNTIISISTRFSRRTK